MIRSAFGDARAFIEMQPYFFAETPQVIAEMGTGDVRLVVNVATHGNEYLPVIAAHKAIALLEKETIHGRVRFTVANPPAIRANKRFVESDLNRIYPGKTDGSLEERLAVNMFPLIDGVPFAVDMHTSPNTRPFVVAVARSSDHVQLEEYLGIPDIALLVMKPEPHAMVQFVQCGVGVELGPHDDPESVSRGIQVIYNAMRGIGMITGELIKPAAYRYYAMTGLISREIANGLPEGTIQDFSPVSNKLIGVSPEDGTTIPILTDPNRTFSDHYSLALKSVTREYLTGREQE